MSVQAIKRVCSRAPVRVDPAGGGTDAPPFCVEHGGAVVNFGVRRYMFASVQRLPPGEGVLIYSVDQQSAVAAESVAALPRGGKMEFLKAFVARIVPDGESIILCTDSDVPSGSGLGGSGALGVATVAAIGQAFDQTRSQEEAAELANDIERSDLGYAGGSQDSYGAAIGGINLIEYPKSKKAIVHRLAVADATLRVLEHRSLLVYTGAAHVSGSIHEDILRSYAEPDSSTVAAMWNLRRTAKAMAITLTSGQIEEYAELLNEACRNLYALHPSCDSPILRQYFDAMGDAVIGGKTCGAGGGGYIIFYTKPGMRQECMRRAESLGGKVETVSIDREGVTSWTEEPLPANMIEKIRHFAK